MPRSLVLHQITVMDLPALEFVRIAGGSGCDAISLFTNSPDVILPGQSARFDFPAITSLHKREALSLLAGQGLTVSGVEYFPLVPGVDLAGYVPGLALGAELGASRAVCHVHDTDPGRAVDAVGRLSELAAAHGLSLVVEFCPMTKGCASLDAAVALVDAVGRADFGIGVDCLHLVRSGGTPADLAALDPRYFGNAQICDARGAHAAETYMHETHDRELPGRGDLPLHAILSALPAKLAIEVEVPASRYRTAGVSAADHIRAAVACARAVVDTLEPRR